MATADTPSSGTFSSKVLPGRKYIARKKNGDRLTIERLPKPAAEAKIVCDITFDPVTGVRGEYRHELLIADKHPDFGGQSTLGYGDIQLPESMQARGIGLIYHTVGGLAAEELGVARFIVYDATNDKINSLCDNSGMTKATGDGYEAKGSVVAKEARDFAIFKGWTEFAEK